MKNNPRLPYSHINREEGFTLAELMAALIIMSILMVFGLTAMMRITENSEFGQASILGKTMEQWSVANPASAIEPTPDYVTYASYKESMKKYNLMLPTVNNEDKKMVKIANSAESRDSYLVCTYFKNNSYDTPTSTGLVAFDSRTGEVSTKNSVCA